jgi:hypothetical protein
LRGEVDVNGEYMIHTIWKKCILLLFAVVSVFFLTSCSYYNYYDEYKFWDHSIDGYDSHNPEFRGSKKMLGRQKYRHSSLFDCIREPTPHEKMWGKGPTRIVERQYIVQKSAPHSTDQTTKNIKNIIEEKWNTQNQKDKTEVLYITPKDLWYKY